MTKDLRLPLEHAGKIVPGAVFKLLHERAAYLDRPVPPPPRRLVGES